MHVTVGGGRNSRLGHGLGHDRTVSAVLSGELSGETVEGVDTARALAELFAEGGLQARDYQLAVASISAVLDDQPFLFNFADLYASQTRRASYIPAEKIGQMI